MDDYTSAGHSSCSPASPTCSSSSASSSSFSSSSSSSSASQHDEKSRLYTDSDTDVESIDLDAVGSRSPPSTLRKRLQHLHHFYVHPLSCRSRDLADTMVTTLRSTPWRSLLLRLLLFLTPSFLQGPEARERIRPAKLSPTAYLDGMRGLAALFVYFCHYSYQAFTIAFSWGAGENNWHPLKLPIVRLFYQGPMAVCVFFVISGYALSYRAMRLARSRSWVEFSSSISSLVFRRGIRLYMPTAISTFMVICLLRVGAYDLTKDFAADPRYMKNVMEPHPARMEGTMEQFEDWIKHMFRFLHVYGWEPTAGSTNYDIHLWTIPIEYRCSLYLFLAMMGTARLQTWIRYASLTAISLFTYRNGRWDMLLFLAGMMIAEHDHIRGAHLPAPSLPLSSASASDYSSSSSDEDSFEKHLGAAPRRRWPKSLPRPWPIFWALLSILALYLLSFPDDGAWYTPGYVLLNAAIPAWWTVDPYRHWQTIGAIVFLFAVGHSPRWQRFFNTAPVQYLGKISYALYLMHGPVMHTVGYHWERLAYAITGTEGYWYNAGFVLGACFAVPSVVWAADIFWRAVDIPTVRFAKWFEGKCLRG